MSTDDARAEPPRAGRSRREDIAEQKAVRLAKRERLIAEGDEAYPVVVPITHTIPQVRDAVGRPRGG